MGDVVEEKAPRLCAWSSIVGDRPSAERLGGSALGGGGARGRGGESELSLSGSAALRATRAQSVAGLAIEHAALRWP